MTNKTPFQLIEDLGAAYKVYRKATGITQKTIREQTGIAISTQSLFENGKGQGLSMENFVKLLSAVGLDDSLGELIPDVPTVDLAKAWKHNNSQK